MATKVSLLRCKSYDQINIEQLLAPLGGMAAFVRPGQTVLIKPNVLSAHKPEDAVTTHPALVSAVIKEVKKAGGSALVGDSPSNAHAQVMQTYAKTGLKSAVESAGGRLVLLQQSGVTQVKSPSGSKRMPLYQLAKIAFEADVIINLPKIKTHNLTAFTGAIKNLFGLVPGFYKAQFHINAIRPQDIAGLFVDILALTRPALNIFDAVVGMEGNGPAGGEPRQLGLLLASADAVALDAVGSYLIGFEPLAIETTRLAHKRGLGTGDLGLIEVIGPRLDEVAQRDWKHSLNQGSLARLLPDPIFNLVKPLTRYLRINPVIDQKKCTRCLVCVRNCPVKTIKTHPPVHDKAGPPPSLFKRGGKEGGEFIVKIEPKNCLNCFCCHEMCEYRAIRLEASWLVKLLGLNL